MRENSEQDSLVKMDYLMFVLIIFLGVICQTTWAVFPAVPCPSEGEWFVSDDEDICRYHWCQDGYLHPYMFACAPGTSALPGAISPSNVCRGPAYCNHIEPAPAPTFDGPDYYDGGDEAHPSFNGPVNGNQGYDAPPIQSSLPVHRPRPRPRPRPPPRRRPRPPPRRPRPPPRRPSRRSRWRGKGGGRGSGGGGYNRHGGHGFLGYGSRAQSPNEIDEFLVGHGGKKSKTNVKVVPHARIYGGKQVYGVKDLDSCFASCTSDYKCEAFDYDKYSYQCWKHSAYTSCKKLSLVEGSVHFSFAHCAHKPDYGFKAHSIFRTPAPDAASADASPDGPRGGEADGSTTETTTTIRPSNAARVTQAPKANITATVYFSVHVAGGTGVPDITDLRTCQDRCKNDSACAGFDFNTKHKSCWFHGKDSVCSGIQDEAGTVHFRLIECFTIEETLPTSTFAITTPGETRTHPHWTTDSNTTDTTLSTTISTTNSGTLQTSEYASATSRGEATHPHWTTDGNTTDTSTPPTKYTTTSAYAATEQVTKLHPTVTTKTTTKPTNTLPYSSTSYPTSNPSSIDSTTLSTYPNSNRTHSSATTSPSPSTIYSSHSSTSTTSSSTSSYESTTPSSSSSGSQQPMAHLGSTAFFHQHVEGGTLFPDLTELTACFFQCAGDFQCQGFDFDYVTMECWLHYEDNVCNGAISRTGTTHFKLITCDSATTAGNPTLHTTTTSTRPTVYPTIYQPQAEDNATEAPNSIYEQENKYIIEEEQEQEEQQEQEQEQDADLVYTNYTQPHLPLDVVTPMPPPTTPAHPLKGYVAAYYGVHVPGGSLLLYNVALKDCLYACRTLSTCQAVDYNFASRSCWAHDADTHCSHLQYLATTNHYKRVTCYPITTEIPSTTSTTSSTMTMTTPAKPYNETNEPQELKIPVYGSSNHDDHQNSGHYLFLNYLGQQGRLNTTYVRRLIRKYQEKHHKYIEKITMYNTTMSYNMTLKPYNENASMYESAFNGTLTPHINTDKPGNGLEAELYTTTPDPAHSSPLPHRASYTLMNKYHMMPKGFVEVRQNIQIPGGTLILQGVSLRQCLDGCLLQHTCLAVDYHTRRRACWFHSLATLCAQETPVKGCNHYRRVPCLHNATNNFYETAYQYHAMNGRLVCTGCDLVTCLELCSDDMGCLGADYDLREQSCYEHDSASVCNQLLPKSYCNHYRKVQCYYPYTTDAPSVALTTKKGQMIGDFSAPLDRYFFSIDFDLPKRLPSGWVAYPGSHIEGSKSYANTSDTDACVQACAKSTSCAAIDFDVDRGMCWFHDKSSVCRTLSSKPLVYHAKRPPGCDIDSQTGLSYPKPVYKAR